MNRESSIITEILGSATTFDDLIPLLRTLDLNNILLEETRSYKSVDRYLYVLQLMPRSGFRRVLDVGVGQGHLAILVQVLYGFDVFGVDINTKYFSRLNSWGITFKKVDIETENLPFKDESKDIVLLCEVLEHLDNPSKVLNKIRRVLSQKGYLVVTTPKRRMPSFLIKTFLILFRDLLHMYPPRYFKKQKKGEPHIKEYTFSEIIKLLSKNNFNLRGFWTRKCIIPPTGIPQGAKSWQACLHRLRLLARKLLFGSKHIDLIICATKK